METENLTIPKAPYLVIVEDDQDDQDVMLELINKVSDQLSVCMLEDGDELFEFLNAIPNHAHFPVMIVLDYNLPRLGGEATLVMLKKHTNYRKIPVVLYSTSMTREKEDDLLSLGANFCRKKPASMEGFHLLLGELVEFAQKFEP